MTTYQQYLYKTTYTEICVLVKLCDNFCYKSIWNCRFFILSCLYILFFYLSSVFINILIIMNKKILYKNLLVWFCTVLLVFVWYICICVFMFFFIYICLSLCELLLIVNYFDMIAPTTVIVQNSYSFCQLPRMRKTFLNSEKFLHFRVQVK